jgi:hypothetical protein
MSVFSQEQRKGETTPTTELRSQTKKATKRSRKDEKKEVEGRQSGSLGHQSGLGTSSCARQQAVCIFIRFGFSVSGLIDLA